MDGDQVVSRKRDNHSGPDFLSDLPLSIIHCILELVPIREAVRTCILSRRWRYIWTTLPHLVFKEEGDLFEWKDLKTFITNVLFLHKGPIHRFRVVYSLAPEDVPYIDNWLLFLSSNEIRDLFIGIRGFKFPLWVHSIVCSFQKLTHLELDKCILPSPHPTFKGFPCLISLVLRDVRVPSKIVESLVANSPLLENFTMSTEIPSDGSELRISASNLKCFDLSGDMIHSCAYLFCWQYLSIGIKSYDHSLVFHHLKFIHLHYFSFEDEDQLAVVGHLMMGAPNLMSLSISPCTYFSGSPHTSYPDFGCGPNFTFNKLRFIIMEDLRCLSREMETIKYLLKSSPVLETMELSSHEALKSEVKSSLMAELISYFRASPNAKVLTWFGEANDHLYAPLVDEVSIELFDDDFTAEQQSSVCNYIKFLGGFTNLKWLRGSLGFTKYLSIGIESYSHSLVFHHLKLICLDEVNFKDKKQIAVVGHLIMAAPNLRTLEISTKNYTSYASEALDFGWAPNLTFNKLRVFRMNGLMKMDDHGRFPCELEFIKILLRSSTTLETMTLRDSHLAPIAISNLMTELPSSRRASPNAKILVKLSSLEFSEM